MLDRSYARANRALPLLNQIAAWALFITVMLAPLPFGSTAPSATAFWCMTLGVGLLAAFPAKLPTGSIRLLALAAVFILAYGIVLHEQLSIDPWLASAKSPLWAETTELLNVPLFPVASVARNQPFYALGPPLCNLLAILCAFIVCSDRDRARQFFQIIAWTGVLYAIFGIATLFLDPTKILWREKNAYQGFLTSTFVNRNTAAVYFGCCGIIWLLFFLENFRGTIQKHRLARLSEIVGHFSQEFPRRLWLPLGMLFVCLAAMFLTGSRAGCVFSLMGTVLALTIFCSREIPQRKNSIIAIVSGAVAALVLFQLLGAGVSGRFNIEGLVDTARLDTYKSTWRIVLDHPWLGTGGGTFPWSFPAYRGAESSMWGTWDRSHNTLLEMASELGLPFATMVVTMWIAILLKLVSGARIRRRDEIFPIAGLVIAIIAITHSLIDFSLQIPGFSITVFAIIGAGLGQSFGSSTRQYG